MIAIFCDFCQFSETKLAFFSKTNVMITFCKNSSGLSKNANIFAKYFGENILKIITSVPAMIKLSCGGMVIFEMFEPVKLLQILEGG
jgi:hypothetical protein